MANNDFSRFSRKVVQYFWDPLPRNEDPSPIWCLSRSYDSRYHESRLPHASPSAQSPESESGTSQADSAVVTDAHTKSTETKPAEPQAAPSDEAMNKSHADLTRSEEEALGWPPEFLDDLESRIWLTYRNNFPPIPKSSDPAASSAMSFSTKLRNLGNQSGFTSDTGWGCMIRSGQSMLANTLAILQLGRDWRVGQQAQAHKDLLALFADSPEAPFSIHKFVEHGAQACGKHPGEWFGPSATARCIQALTDSTPTSSSLRVHVRPDDSDIYTDGVLATATTNHTKPFAPTLILLGTRLGIDRITPVYHAGLKQTLHLPHCVGIAGGRPSSSHYFLGHQGDSFFYLDPHSTRPALPAKELSELDVQSCHTRRVRRVDLAEMDPSMLLGFLVTSEEDFKQWREAVVSVQGKAVVHVHDGSAKYVLGGEREGAVDEVEAWDDEE